MSKEVIQEVIDEIGTQTLARFGLNIFGLGFNTYNAYGSSVLATEETARAYNRHKNNDKCYGQAFEELDVGQSNILNALRGKSEKTYTTDTLAEIKRARDILRSGKKLENLSPKDRANVEYIRKHYSDEVKNLDFSDEKLKNIARVNHETTDVVTLNEKSKVVNTAQHKVIKNTKDLLKDKYLDSVDEIKVPFDDYVKHKKNLEKMISEGKGSNDPKKIEQAKKAETALEKLNANNFTNRLMCENPRATAVMTQSLVAATHIGQAGFSDAIVVALSTLANGLIWELKDMYENANHSTPITQRIERLVKKVLESFKRTFVRGASFGAIDIIVNTLEQIFKRISATLRLMWSQLRSSVKSIYNAIYSYIKGEIKSMQDLIGAIIKALFSAAFVGIICVSESQLDMLFGPFAGFLSPAFSIVIGSLAIVTFSKGVDLVLDSIFGVIARCEKAKMRCEEITSLVAERLPALIEEREALEKIIHSTHKQRLLGLEASFENYCQAYENCNDPEIFNALSQINQLWGAKLTIKEISDVQKILENPNRTGFLKWQD